MQFHANYDPKKYVASFLKQHYKGQSVQILHGCCRKCLKHGNPAIHNLSTHPWDRLLSEGTIDPYQAAAVFIPPTQFHSARFKNPMLDLKAPELPCKYPGTCEQTCLMCSKYIDGPGIELKQWPGFKVHAQCTSKCQFPDCHARLPDFPAYITYQRSQFVCEEHQLTKGFQRMSIGGFAAGAFTTTTVRKEVKTPIKTPAKPIPLPTPIRKIPGPRAEDETKKPDTPQIKKTVQFKAQFHNIGKKGKAKADKYDGDKSQRITSFFQSPGNPSYPTTASIKEMLPAPEEPPRRFIRNKSGVIYAYWKADVAHCIDTDAVLFKSNHGTGKRVYAPRCKLDFSPPVRLTPMEDANPAAPAKGE
jgi:hypothetical protein